jgi:hypothetical protein
MQIRVRVRIQARAITSNVPTTENAEPVEFAVNGAININLVFLVWPLEPHQNNIEEIAIGIFLCLQDTL